MSFVSDPIIGYSGEETSGLESSFTSPSVHKDFIDQYLNKLSYLPGDVITNSEPGLVTFVCCFVIVVYSWFFAEIAQAMKHRCDVIVHAL